MSTSLEEIKFIKFNFILLNLLEFGAEEVFFGTV